jgi:polyferredoxin
MGVIKLKRQKFRKGLILVSFLLFPVVLYYLSPYLIIQGAFEGIVTGSFIFFTILFVVSLFLGRAFCGWVCPAGGLQECCSMVTDKRASGGKRNWIKYFIWVPWISIIALMFKNAGGIKTVNFFYLTDHGISVTVPEAYIIYYGVILLIVLLAFLAGKRSFCHYVCWMAPFMVIGTKVKNALGYPSLKLKSEKDKCIGCKVCTKRCPMSLDVMNMVQTEKMVNSECILCGECVDGCPKKAIRYSIKK